MAFELVFIVPAALAVNVSVVVLGTLIAKNDPAAKLCPFVPSSSIVVINVSWVLIREMAKLLMLPMH